MSDRLKEQSFLSHLIELRDRLLRMVLAVLILLVLLFPFGNDIFSLLSQPVVNALPEGSSMLATKVLSPFLTPLKLAFVASLMIAMPYILFQLWGFIAPGLYKHEKKLAIPMVGSSIVLFYIGASFAYFVVLPLLFPFLVGIVPENVEVAPDIADFLDVAIKLFFAFGMAFEVPIATILLVITGMTTPEKLVQKRPYIIVGAFVVGMLLTPPDVISQTLLAIPVWLLFEIGLILSRFFLKRRKISGKNKDTDSFDENEFDDSSTMESKSADNKKESSSSDYKPMTDIEMENELDKIEEEEKKDIQEDQISEDLEPFIPDEVDSKLEEVMRLRNLEEYDEARSLLYQILSEGNELQIRVARNILDQLDS
tara:strand:+ start:1831 stop:2934 length:1104 start_codon:yes stop_codon:yes gene_type:complete